MKKSVLIISYVPPYNRQGYDLAESLRNSGYDVSLYQQDGHTDRANRIVGIKVMRAHGLFHKLHSLRNFLAFLIKTLFVRKQVVICVGRPLLVLGALYSVVFGSRLIWYSLEYVNLRWIDRFIYKNCVSGYVDVEENRLRAIFEKYGRKENACVIYNVPHKIQKVIEGGKLRSYLADQYGVSLNEKLIVYAGSYQRYACLDRIIEASRMLSEGQRLIIMAFGIPAEYHSNDSSKCIIIPPIRGVDFYEWLMDADCALLPYEDSSDFNVINCSPQKIFDCFAVGVPFIVSNCPIARKIHEEFDACCLFCDFTDSADIIRNINIATTLKSRVADKMKELHQSKYNYDSLSKLICTLIDNV